MLKQGLALGLWLMAVSSGLSAADPSYREVLDKYCVTCHNQRLKTGGLALDNTGSWPRFRPRRRSGKRSSASCGRAPCRRRDCRGPMRRPISTLAGWLEAQIDQAFGALRRPPHPAPSESLRIRQCDPRSAGAGYRCRCFASSRRFGVWIRQYLRCAGAFAVAAGTLS